MQDIVIRRLDAADPHLDEVAGWTFEAWGHLSPARTRQSWREDFAADCGATGVPSVFVAERAGIPAGTASLVVDDMSIRPDLTPWLASVYVIEEQRSQGIASALVRRVEEEAQSCDIATFYLYTPDQQALYRRLGWLDVEEVDYRGERVTIMRRQLSP
ncbi:GNAT family N-acetyltransferase [Halomonas cupida]|uniref:GNAT family N-acetyltransferase n=1 Tax=Halomonas cupida TaxID=44933 RepID=UPI003A8D6AF7